MIIKGKRHFAVDRCVVRDNATGISNRIFPIEEMGNAEAYTKRLNMNDDYYGGKRYSCSIVNGYIIDGVFVNAARVKSTY